MKSAQSDSQWDKYKFKLTQIPFLAYQDGKNLIDWQHTIGKAVRNNHSQCISTAYMTAKWYSP